tara:strand:- start:1332 stop:1667 length:336 start_codon:yes stop_codon:yes gene_type:complete
MKLHNKRAKKPGMNTWGELKGMDIRINFGVIDKGDSFPEEALHYHKSRNTYFCVITGSLQIEVEGQIIEVTNEAMLQVFPNEKYRVVSVGDDGATYVVVGDHAEADKVTLD